MDCRLAGVVLGKELVHAVHELKRGVDHWCAVGCFGRAARGVDTRCLVGDRALPPGLASFLLR